MWTMLIIGFMAGSIGTMIFGVLLANASESHSAMAVRGWMILMWALTVFVVVSVIDYLRIGVLL